MATWKSIGIIEDGGKPKVLQQRCKYDESDPRDKHRVVPIIELEGVTAEQLTDSLASDLDIVA